MTARKRCEICSGPRGRGADDCYCGPCKVIVARIAEPRGVADAWPRLLPVAQRLARRVRLSAHAVRVWAHYRARAARKP